MVRVRQIKIEVSSFNMDLLKEKTAKKLKINVENIKDINIIKESIDARDKNEIFYVFEVNVEVVDEENIIKKLNNPDIFISPSLEYTPVIDGNEKLDNPIVVVGSGPAGLFATYNLLLNGYKVILIERGEDVDNRINSINSFFETNKLNTKSNVQFGCGGAGTFSDGKLNTLVKDEANRGRFVFKTFIENGANEDILYNFHPHIGTDLLRVVVKNLTNKIESLGGIIKYNTCLTNINIDNNKVKSIIVNNDEVINTENVILCLGNSARDTFYMLKDLGLEMTSKPIAVGLRVIHNQNMISESQYGKKYMNLLPPATYKLTYQASNGRGVYSFCMCPGGYVVNSSSEEGLLSINGMSYNKRDGENSNSAIVVTVTPKDYGEGVLDGVEFQRHLEKEAFKIGNGQIPIQTLKDFKENKITTKLGNVSPTIKGAYNYANINEILPDYMCNAIKEAFASFEHKIKGFSNDDTILAAIESRTSSPIRMYRDENFESNIKGIYPCGEGAGYSGGITTSAIDGLRVSEALMHKYHA